MSQELGPKARALLQATRFADDATQADADRVHAAVLARLAVGTTAAAGAAATATGAKQGGIAAILGGAGAKSALGAVALSTKVVACLGLATAVGVGATFAVRHAHDAAPRAIVAPAVHPPASPIANEIAPSAAAPMPDLPVPSSLAATTGEARAPARAVSQATPLDAEVAMLRDARQALRDGRAARALALLDEHARRFPHGVLAEDCAAERVFALCALGSVDQARAEGLRFLASHGLSPHADAVRASCGVGTSATPAAVTPPAR
jgi:hypothetical protein